MCILLCEEAAVYVLQTYCIPWSLSRNRSHTRWSGSEQIRPPANFSQHWSAGFALDPQHCWVCPFPPFNPYSEGGRVRQTLLLKEWGEGRKNERKKIIYGWCRGQKKLLSVNCRALQEELSHWWPWCLCQSSPSIPVLPGLRMSCGCSPGRFQTLSFACGEQKTCNCFCNLNNISGLEAPGDKSLSGWAGMMINGWGVCSGSVGTRGVSKTLFSGTLGISSQEGTSAMGTCCCCLWKEVGPGISIHWKSSFVVSWGVGAVASFKALARPVGFFCLWWFQS